MPQARAALARASIAVAPEASFAQRGDNFRPDLDVGIDHLVVGIGELRREDVANAAQRGAEARAHIAREVEIHQSIGRADVYFGVAIAGGLEERVETGPGSISTIAFTASMRTSATGSLSMGWSLAMAPRALPGEIPGGPDALFGIGILGRLSRERQRGAEQHRRDE